MKKLMLVCCMVIGAVTMSFAQGGGQGGQGGGQGRGFQMDPAAQVARLKTALTLTDDQVTKITALYTAQNAKMDSLRKANPDPTAMRTAMQPMREATTAKLKALLTPEQAAAYDKMPRGGRGGQGGGQGGQGGGAAPAPAQR